ncbi:trehalose 6-phosphate phosphatase [Cupriavidus metallidurans]|jgi:trehalose 6-phosphate phosphatase|nr:trehalose-phosphatase [Cupriavidus metallidurans]AVA32505.1 trehalose-phosphatase [Cupriavidus metallidurans]MDE4916662.1 trehalose-phosphatase [Cupriavidus metallidurans]QGS28414.1 trehalose-phosphatase [Cupriavidus metallidurans]UBM11369.1 trehalose-phosphatase [Cupriavidus metallidurans]
MSSLPLIEPDTALFLDFDGTLADLAPRPELVQVEPELVGTLRALHTCLDGALAIISGRPVAELDGFLQPLRLPAAGVHGAELRHDGEALFMPPAPGITALMPRLEAFVARHPGLRIERKSVAVAIHYRQAPELEAQVRAMVADTLHDVDGLEGLPGKMVVEIKPAGVDKGGAIAAFMRMAPFEGRKPLFAGDDVTDEAGFVVARELGGVGVLVGERATAATVSVTGPAALRCWLHRSAHALLALRAQRGGKPQSVSSTSSETEDSL